MSLKDKYWAEREDIENEHKVKLNNLLVRHKGVQGGIGNPDEYEKAKFREELVYNDNLKDVNTRYGVQPRMKGEDGNKVIERINKTLEAKEGTEGGESNGQ